MRVALVRHTARLNGAALLPWAAAASSRVHTVSRPGGRLLTELLLFGLLAGLAFLVGASLPLAGPWPAAFLVGATLCVVALVTASLETLIGIWLVALLIDPALPSIGPLTASDAILPAIVLKFAVSARPVRRVPRAFTLALVLIGVSELLLFAVGSTPESAAARSLVTLLSLAIVAFITLRVADWPRVVRWLAIASLTAALLAISQYVIWVVTGVVVLEQNANLFYVRTGLGEAFRATGIGTGSNFLAMSILPGIGIGLVGALEDQRRTLRWTAYVGVCILGILATGSRGGLIALVAGGFLVLLLRTWSPRNDRSRRLVWTALLLCAMAGTPKVLDVLHAQVSVHPATLDIRVAQLGAVFEDAVNGNWVGKGHGALITTALPDELPFLQTSYVVHNTVLQPLYEAGWIGFLGVLVLFVGGLLRSSQALWSGPEPHSRERALDLRRAMVGAAFILLTLGLGSVGGYFMRHLWVIWAVVLAASVPAVPPSRLRKAHDLTSVKRGRAGDGRGP